MNFKNPKVELTVDYPSDPEGYVEVEHPNFVAVDFTVEHEAREWGIKSTDVFVRGTLEIPLAIIRFDTNADGIPFDRTLAVDLSKIPVEYVSGKWGACYVSSLTVKLNGDWSVNHEKSSIEVLR